MSYENISPLAKEIRELRELEKTIVTVSGNSRNAHDVNVLLKKEIVDRVAVLCRSFLEKYDATPYYDKIRTEGAYADLFGMLRIALEELRK